MFSKTKDYAFALINKNSLDALDIQEVINIKFTRTRFRRLKRFDHKLRNTNLMIKRNMNLKINQDILIIIFRNALQTM